MSRTLQLWSQGW